MKTLTELELEMDQYLIAGTIPNARYQEIKSNLSRFVYDEGKELQEKTGWHNPFYITSINAEAKRLARHKDKENERWKMTDAFCKKYLPLAEKLKQLKPLILKGKK